MELPEPGAAIDAGENVAEAPVGRPETESETAELKPPETVVVTVAVVWPPAVAETEDGETVTAKSGVAWPAQLSASALASTVPRPVARS